ncbi:hypothetical protein P153DRAFT_113999 [Dothidotthia symphoricarpi CBS 119687]|uniref:Uncharacterized protein n=1 Tax=Dothidotthia symphoricarpi CBS 119687 TaxID=1392245 RepID=A0A6A6A3J2_9PLEO|nr:uncharacterized protein P153DRAFT_113999 [Dothidotthia symphoricarpi CBS 119687]KAF2125477.1 hypothetical protein P153DRAFT_113999 [Dothidotthia symphoricarpi CBS 119687]
MPHLPPGASRNLVSAIPTKQWMDWADGKPIGPAPHTIRPTEYGCMINRDFIDDNDKNDIISYKKGMQGHFLEERFSNVNTKVAKIYIRGVTDSKEYPNRWVPRAFIDVGQPWKADFKDWKVEASLFTTIVDSRRWKTDREPDNSTLGKTVTKLVAAFRAQPPDYLGIKLSDFIDRYGGSASVSQTIIDGIKAAGLYNILNTPNFTMQDLLRQSKCKIPSSSSSKKAGVYARFHKSGPNVTHWKPNTTYAYTGFSRDFDERFDSHRANKALYGDLTRNSTQLSSVALCVLDSTLEHGFFYLTEQIFVCILETYRAILSIPSSGNANTISFTYATKYFLDVSKEVFRITGWCGAVNRPSFGISEGTNYSSPLLEYSNMSDKTLFIRTDAQVRDELTGRSVPMAFFRRTKMNVVPPSGRVVAFKHREPEIGGYISFTHEPWTDGAEGPIAGTPYQLVFEVCKDGTPHPQSWSRLPEVGPFKNWNQARSWAVRIEWENPKNSGKWQFTYLQAGHVSGGGLFALADENVPGSLKIYAKSIQFLQWLCNAPPAHTHNWIKKYSGAARVLQAEYDMMKQTVRFQVPTDQIPMISGARKHDDDIKAELRDPKHKLENVDGEFGAFTGKASFDRKREKCDLCVVVWRHNKPLRNGACLRIGNSRVCENCRHLGRPCCSWTRGTKKMLPDMSQFSPEEIVKANAICSALFLQLPTKIAGTLQNFDNKLRALDSSDDLVDDGDEIEDEVDVEDEDEEEM